MPSFIDGNRISIELCIFKFYTFSPPIVFLTPKHSDYKRFSKTKCYKYPCPNRQNPELRHCRAIETKHALMASIRRLPFTDGSAKPRRGRTPLAGKGAGRPAGAELVQLRQREPCSIGQARQLLNGEMIHIDGITWLNPNLTDTGADVGYPGDAIDRERERRIQ